MPGNGSKSCHNCRRRRLRCDRSWPGCHKCALAGQECLGYGKVFVWTQALDARVKPRPSPRSSAHQRFHHPRPLHRRHGGEGGGHADATTGYFSPCHDADADCTTGPGPDRDASTSTSTRTYTRSPPLGAAHGTPLLARHPPPQRSRTRLDRDPATSAASGPNAHARAAQAQAQAQSQAGGDRDQPCWTPPAYATLTDPLFQDLDRNSRYYLAHFADRVCRDLVARDAPGANPFRELIPLTYSHPLLLQVLVATSAIHWSNIRPVTTIPAGLSDPGGYLAQLRSKDLVSRQALIDALIAKQKAMRHLQAILNDTLDPAGSQVALAATHFFIKFDLIDLDKREGKGWRTHLQGSSSILGLLTSLPEGKRSASSLMLRDCVIADCFIYHVLGSTLASGKLAANIARYALDLMPVMQRVEVNSYLSCPPELLYIILQASQLSYEQHEHESPSAAASAAALLDAALAFDIPAWAARLRAAHRAAADIQSRIHIASAHRAAVCLYILHALPLARAARPLDADLLAADILAHLALIRAHDPYFKATSWPTFLAGAQARDPPRRAIAMRRLLAIWHTCPWGYIFTAIEMLKVTWDMQDAHLRAGADAPLNWLHGLKRMGYDCLIV